MAKNIKPTTKNSPAITTGKAPFNKPASDYAPAHTMSGEKYTSKDMASENLGMDVVMPSRKNWTPLNGGVSIGHFDEVKTDGIEMRGAGAATKGRMSRGPQA
jgi:hypothetical protein